MGCRGNMYTAVLVLVFLCACLSNWSLYSVRTRWGSGGTCTLYTAVLALVFLCTCLSIAGPCTQGGRDGVRGEHVHCRPCPRLPLHLPLYSWSLYSGRTRWGSGGTCTLASLPSSSSTPASLTGPCAQGGRDGVRGEHVHCRPCPRLPLRLPLRGRPLLHSMGGRKG
jgi:hypothetical protein